MKRKVKRYDEGGILTDRYGNPVKSGSGETVKTRYSSSAAKEDKPTSSGTEDYASMGKRAGATSTWSGAPTIKEESTTETEMPSSSRSSSEESTAGKGARNLALEEPEVEVKKKTVIKKKSPKYEDTGAKIGSQDFKINTPKTQSSSGMGPKNTFLTKERMGVKDTSTGSWLERAKEHLGNEFKKRPSSEKETEAPAKIGNQSFESPKEGRGLTPYAKGKSMQDWASMLGKGAKKGGSVKMASGGKTSTASSRGDGIAQRGKTRGRIC